MDIRQKFAHCGNNLLPDIARWRKEGEMLSLHTPSIGARLRNRWVVLVATVLASLIVMTACAPEHIEVYTESLEEIKEWLAEGNALVLLCTRSDLSGCKYLGDVTISSQPVKWGVQDLPPEIGDDNLRSLMMVCGIRTAILVYSSPHFQGRMDVYHCKPGETLEVRQMGYMEGVTSSMVFTSDEYFTEGLEAYFHTGVNLMDAMEGFREGIREGFEAEEDIEDVPLIWKTQIYWTDAVNIYGIPYDSPEYDIWRDMQIVSFLVGMDVDPNWWPSDYQVIMGWDLHPIVMEPDNSLGFEVADWSLWVEEGWMHDRIYNGISPKMAWIGQQIGEAIRDEIEAIGDEVEPGFGEALVRGIESIGWTVFDPKPCTPYPYDKRAPVRPVDDPCHYYKNVPPTLILNREDN